MRWECVDLRNFYGARRGKMVRRMIRRRVRAMWPNTKNMTILGLGYATPYLRNYMTDSNHVVAFMPGPQGAIPWPTLHSAAINHGGRETHSLVALSEEDVLPLPDASVDRLLMVHMLEHASNGPALLREAWRVLKDDGKLLLVVPHRRSMWTRFDRTPFGIGHPYSYRELGALLRKTLFTPLRREGALFIPPFRSKLSLSLATIWENLAHKWFPKFSGVLVVEAGKEIYGGELNMGTVRQRRAYAPVPLG